MLFGDWTGHGTGYADFGDFKVYDRDVARLVKKRLTFIERLNVLRVVETAFEIFAKLQDTSDSESKAP